MPRTIRDYRTTLQRQQRSEGGGSDYGEASVSPQTPSDTTIIIPSDAYDVTTGGGAEVLYENPYLVDGNYPSDVGYEFDEPLYGPPSWDIGYDFYEQPLQPVSPYQLPTEEAFPYRPGRQDWSTGPGRYAPGGAGFGAGVGRLPGGRATERSAYEKLREEKRQFDLGVARQKKALGFEREKWEHLTNFQQEQFDFKKEQWEDQKDQWERTFEFEKEKWEEALAMAKIRLKRRPPPVWGI